MIEQWQIAAMQRLGITIIRSAAQEARELKLKRHNQGWIYNQGEGSKFYDWLFSDKASFALELAQLSINDIVCHIQEGYWLHSYSYKWSKMTKKEKEFFLRVEDKLKARLCSESNCNGFCVPGSCYCAKHKAESDRRRALKKPFENAKRTCDYSDPAWKKLRRSILDGVFCAYCGTKDNLQVHHINPVREHPELFLKRENCMVLCKSCHAAVTAREIQRRKKR